MSSSRRYEFGDFLRPNSRPYQLGPEEDANLLGVRWYGEGPFHRELKPATKIAKKSHFVVRDGDVIYNKLFAWKGSIGMIPPDLDGMFVSDKFPTYELDRAKVDDQFFKWYCRYPPLWEEARQMSRGSAAISKLTLNPGKFLRLTVPHLSLLKQQRLVEEINKLAAHVSEAHVLQLAAREEAAALLTSVLRRFQQEVTATGRLAEILIGPPRNGWSAQCDNIEDGTPVLSLGAVTGFDYRSSEFKRTSLPTSEAAHYWLQPGDLLMTRSNTPELVGHAAVFSGQPFPCIYPDLMMKLNVNKEQVEPRFVWYWLQTPLVRDFVKRNAKGTSPTMRKISQPIVMAIPFPTSLQRSQQTRIVLELDGLRGQLDALKQLQIATTVALSALMPAVIDRAFKGQL